LKFSSNHNQGYQINCQSGRTIRVTSTAARTGHAYAMCLAIGIQRSDFNSMTSFKIFTIYLFVWFSS
ncbi:hypothetical protein JG687_00015689, partial [Phytophthora cactorum]